MASIRWNQQVRLIISDVDETVADLYTDARPAMIAELKALLEEGLSILFVSGQSLLNIQQRVLAHIDPALRQQILVGHCSGAEVWSFDSSGQVVERPLYSHYANALTLQQQRDWHALVERLVTQFHLRHFPTMPVQEFKRLAGDDPLAIMLEDRGPQITLECVNSYALSGDLAHRMGLPGSVPGQVYDLRDPMIAWAASELKRAGVPVTPRRAGIFAIDFALRGVSKTTAVGAVLEDAPTLRRLGLAGVRIDSPEAVEIWGDKFAVQKGGTDFAMSVALPPEVRSITFRDEDPADLPAGYNIQIWDGAARLHDGLLEYLQERPR